MTKKESWHNQVLTIKAIAAKKNLSNYEISKKTGVNQSSISRIFSLETCPNLRTFHAIRDFVLLEDRKLLSDNPEKR